MKHYLFIALSAIVLYPINSAHGEVIPPFGGFEWGITVPEFQAQICSDANTFSNFNGRVDFCGADLSEPIAKSYREGETVPTNLHLGDSRAATAATERFQVNGIQPYAVQAEVRIGPVEVFGAPFEMIAVFGGLEEVIARDHLENIDMGEFPDDRCWTPTEGEASDPFDADNVYCEYHGRLALVVLRAVDERGMEIHGKISDRLIELYGEPFADSAYIDEYGDFNSAHKNGTLLELGLPVRGGGILRITYRGEELLRDDNSRFKDELISRKTVVGNNDAAGQL